MDGLSGDKLYRSLVYDPVEGFPGIGSFRATLGKILQGQRRGAYALVVTEIDDFKRISRVLGSAMMDSLRLTLNMAVFAVLRQLQENYSQWCRAFSLSRDQIAIILASDQARDGLGRLGSELKNYLQSQVSHYLPYSEIRISIGVYGLYPQSMEEELNEGPMEILYRAEAAAEFARTGTGVHVYDTALDGELKERVVLEDSIRRIPLDDCLFVCFQSLVDVESGKVVGAEALARLKTDGQLIPARKFLPLANDLGMVKVLSQKVVQAAATLMKSPGHFTGSFVSINVPFEAFRDEGFVADIVGAVKNSTLAPESFRLETVVESRFGTEEKRQMQTLRDFGIGIALDRFGSVPSSPSLLSSLPFSAVKLDRDFLSIFGDDGRADALTRGLIALTKSLGLEVIATGVENEKDFRAVRELGISVAQGHYFGPEWDIAGIAQ